MQFRKKYLYSVLLFAIVACSKNDVPSVSQTPPPVTPPANTTFTNPLLTSGPDPWVIKKDSFYYYTQTSGNRIELWKTKAMSNLGSSGSQTIWTKPSSGPNSENVWAPELHYLDGKWYMYYTAGTNGDINTVQRIFVLENSSPDPTQGTWVDKGSIADPAANFWAIDPTVSEIGSNKYLVWSGHASNSDYTQRIYIARMQNPWTLATGRTQISSPDFPWEKIGAPPAVNEGPEILMNSAGNVFLVFSASGCWTDDYSMGISALKNGGDPLNAADWVKSSTPIFTKSPANGAYGPGHCAFFKSANNKEDWIIYHANSSANQGCTDSRNPRMQKFSWKPDGTPDFGEPVPINTQIAKPAGE